jgi:outer membrane protein, heavy metal efflux system
MEILKARDEFTPLAVQIRSTLAARKTAVGAANGGYYTTTVVPQAQRLLETAVGQYNVMQLGVFQLLQARDRKIRASLEYVTALSTYWKERAACANPRGKLPDETARTAATPTISGAPNASGNQP